MAHWRNVCCIHASSAVVTVANTTTETILATITVPDSAMDAVGRNLHLRLHGIMETKATPVGDFVMRVRRTNAAGTLIATASSADDNLLGNKVTSGWDAAFDIMVVTGGAGGTVEATGSWATQKEVSNTPPQRYYVQNLAATALNVAGAFNLVVTIAMATASASNVFEKRLSVAELGGLS